MKKVAIHGSYFGRNFGDTLILHIIKNWINDYSDEIEINLPFVNSKEEAFEILQCNNKEVEIKDVDGLIFGPGGYFGEQPGSFFRRLQWSIRNYKRHISWNDQLYFNNIPYMIVGVGVGPISFNFLRRKIIKLFANAALISVRDKYSKQYLIDWGIPETKIHIAPDVALTLTKNNDKVVSERPKVGLHYTNKNLVKAKDLDEFIQFIKNINVNNDIFFIEDAVGQFSNENENNLKNILIKEGLNIPIIEYKSPPALLEEIKQLDLFITSKLHVGIVSYALGKKSLSIPLHTKTIRFYEQIKRENFCVPFESMNAKLLTEKFNELTLLKDSDNVLYNEAILNKKLVNNFLESIL